MSNLPLNHQNTGQPANDAGYAALMAVKPGERLRKARKERKLDLEAAAEQLNLSVSVLKALENDDYAAMPSTTFVKGYIRSYSRMLRLPGDELVRAFEYQTGAHSAMDEQHPVPQKQKKRKMGPILVVGVILLIVVAALWWFSGGDEPSNAAPQASQESGQVAAQEPQPILQEPQPVVEEPQQVEQESQPISQEPQPIPQEPQPIPQEPPVEESLPVVAQAQPIPQPVSVNSPVEANEPVDTAVAPEPAPAIENPAPDTSSGVVFEFQNAANSIVKGALGMTFSEDCWVEIRNERGRLLHADLHRAGSTYQKELPEPFEVKLGNGSAVKVKYNGSPIVFAQSSRSKVARFRIGQFSNSEP